MCQFCLQTKIKFIYKTVNLLFLDILHNGTFEGTLWKSLSFSISFFERFFSAKVWTKILKSFIVTFNPIF